MHALYIDGVSQARLTSAKGLVNCVYKLCPTTLYNAVQSRSILSHDALHHHSSSNSSLENGKGSWEIFSTTAEAVKTL